MCACARDGLPDRQAAVQRPWGNTVLGAFKDSKEVSMATGEKTRPGGVGEGWGHGGGTDEDLASCSDGKAAGRSY